MNASKRAAQNAGALRSSVAVAAVLAVVAAVAIVAFATPTVASGAHLTTANGAPEQWAFGGIASASYSCSDASCFGGNVTNETLSVTFQYYLEWVVIFTQTNVSASQTMIESQAALNASAKYTFSGCIPNGTGPCLSESGSLSLAGKETAVGFTNLTTGTVNMTSPPNGSVPALAIMDGSSQESFNFSGSYSVSGPFGPGGVSESVSANFDFGANEATSVAFSTPLGVVPLNPQPGDAWNASAPFSATGSWTSGYSFSATGYSGSGGSVSNWTSGTVAPSGVLFVNGTDLGAYTLYDNYTHPATQVTAQLIALDFNNGTFEAADGWVLIPFGMYNGVLYGISGSSLAVDQGASHGLATAASAPSALGAPTGESAYYEQGHGFIGAAASGSASSPVGSTGPSVSITAGPEPLSVAQDQYNAVTSSGGGGSPSSSSFPWAAVVVAAVVVVIIAALAVVLVTRRSRRRPPASTIAPGAVAPGTMVGPAAPGPTPPVEPTSVATVPPTMAAPPPPPPAPTAPVCPRCGQPGSYIAQYGRFYCYNDRQYL